MRLLHPTTGEVDDLVALYGGDERPAHPDGRPWVLLDFVASADGATTTADGVSGDLGGTADKAAFHAIRTVADVVLVGAGTVRAERYGPPRAVPEAQAARAARGQDPAPWVAVVSGSLDLDPASRLFSDPARRPVVLTAASAVPTRRRALEEVADVVDVGEAAVDLVAAVTELGRRGARVVLCEGGPSLAGQLAAAGLVDELCLSIAPVLVGGASARVAHGPDVVPPAGLRLDRVLEQDDVLVLRYVRA